MRARVALQRTSSSQVSMLRKVRPSSRLGQASTAAYFFNGMVDELSFYARALTTAEIQSIYGAGSAGMALLREIRSNPSLGWKVHGLVDDNPIKIGQTLMGVSVLGRGRQLPVIVDRFRTRGIKIDEIVIAMPSATGRAIREALANCR